MGRKQYQAKQFIEAIPGTSGIISTIAKRVGCSWGTAKAFIEEFPTVKAVYEAEQESILDIAESVLINNIKLALKEQQEGKVMVDTADTKWLLSRKGKVRGYAERQEITGAEGGAVEHNIIGIDEIIKKVRSSLPK